MPTRAKKSPPKSRSYRQFCGLARALDHVGDRWVLLIVRQLLLGDASYGDLLGGLHGVPTNLLADRLRELEASGLVLRQSDHADGRRVIYSLTPLGHGLEPAVHALVRWGAHWMESGPEDDRFDPAWLRLALHALLGDRTATTVGSLELNHDEGTIAVISERSAPLRVENRALTNGRPDARLEGDATLMLAVAAGRMTLAAARRRGLKVRGDLPLARAILQPS